MPRKPYKLTDLHVDVADDGLTVPVAGKKVNAQVALDVDIPQFMREFVELLVR
jgi:hypothetical protein